jgi:hypothetical protein
MKLVSNHLISGQAELAAEFQQATPFRHLVMESFFEPEFAEALRRTFPAFDDRLARNENGEIGGKCTHEDLTVLGDEWRAVDRLIQTPEFLGWLGRVTGIDELLYDPHYFGGGTHENRHGQDLDPHVDFNRHPITGWHRRLNLIVYLNPEWRPEWGGAIEFHKNPRLPVGENQICMVQPAFNRAVLFETTHWSWHGFERIDLPDGDADARSRKSLALYFYSKTRPDEEVVDPHSTIYVDRPLPERIQPGMTLSEEDHAEIVRLMARRDQHLERLYRTVSSLSAQLESARDSALIGLYRRTRAAAGRAARAIGLRRSFPR